MLNDYALRQLDVSTYVKLRRTASLGFNSAEKRRETKSYKYKRKKIVGLVLDVSVEVVNNAEKKSGFFFRLAPCSGFYVNMMILPSFMQPERRRSSASTRISSRMKSTVRIRTILLSPYPVSCPFSFYIYIWQYKPFRQWCYTFFFFFDLFIFGEDCPAVVDR